MMSSKDSRDKATDDCGTAVISRRHKNTTVMEIVAQFDRPQKKPCANIDKKGHRLLWSKACLKWTESYCVVKPDVSF